MCEGPRSIGWALALWEPAIYLEDISPNHPNKIKQPTQTPSHTHIHNYSLGKGCNSRLNHQGQEGQCFRNSGKALYLLVTFQMHQGLWTVSCLLDSLLPSGWRRWEPKERERARTHTLACARGMPFFRAKINWGLKIRQEAEHWGLPWWSSG